MRIGAVSLYESIGMVFCLGRQRVKAKTEGNLVKGVCEDKETCSRFVEPFALDAELGEQ